MAERGPSPLLTALIPTRNRSDNFISQLRLFAASSFPHPIVVADSSDAEHAARIRAASAGRVQFHSYPPETKFFDKLANAVATIDTPYVLLAADRKITFPHAVEAALTHLLQHDDCVGAQGLVIGFGRHGDDIDINRVVFFTPAIADDDPLQRHYHLMRRYQSWQFAVFRREPLIAAIAQARTVSGAMFEEVMFMNASVLQGRLVRLPHIMTLQTVEQSFNPLTRIDPLYWFLDNSRSFFRHYILYRNSLARFIAARRITVATDCDLHQLLDTVHAVWLNYNFDHGVLNHATRRFLGDDIPPLPHPRPPLPWRPPTGDDVVHATKHGRRYIWRGEVLSAEPREEIEISVEEIARVERQLDWYFGD